MKNLKLIFLTLIVLSGCEDKKIAPPNWTSVDIPDRVKMSKSEITSDEYQRLRGIADPVAAALDSLRLVCSQTPGAVFTGGLECRCRDEADSFYARRASGSFVGYCAMGSLGESLNFESLISNLEIRLNPRPEELDPHFVGPIAPGDRQWLMRVLEQYQRSPRLPVSYYLHKGATLTTKYYVGPNKIPSKNVFGSVKDQFLDYLAVDRRPESSLSWNEGITEELAYYVPELEEVPFAIGLETESNLLAKLKRLPEALKPAGHGLPSVGFAEATLMADELGFDEPLIAPLRHNLERIQSVYRIFQSDYSSSFSPNAVRSNSIFGCLDICQLSMNISLKESSAVVRWVKHFVRGHVNLQYLLIESLNGRNLEGLILMNAGEYPSIILSSKYALNAEKTKLTYSLQAYDRTWAWAGLTKKKSGDQVSVDLEIERRRTSSMGDQGVLFCDEPSQYDDAVRGPHDFEVEEDASGLARFKGSLSGWFANSSGSVRLFLSGSAGVQPETGLFLEHGGTHSRAMIHASRSAYERTGDDPYKSKFRFSLLYAPDCLSDYSQWRKSVMNSGFRIINMSFSNSYDPLHCERISTDLLKFSDDPLLWVLAAGNDGKSSSSKALGCPQNILNPSWIRRSIRVAAVDRANRVWDLSNTGDTIELAAPGYFDDSNVSTSLATAVVSGAANELYRKAMNSLQIDNHDLSPQLIRMALILGAKMPHGRPLQGVISGGIVDARSSWKLLTELARVQKDYQAEGDPESFNHLMSYIHLGIVPQNTAQVIFAELYCPGVKYDSCREAKRKVEYLKSMQVVR